MQEEENIKQELEERFIYLKDRVILQRKRRVYLSVSLQEFPEVFGYIVKQMGFSNLSAITGLDEEDSFSIFYHLNREGRLILSLKAIVDKNSHLINTVTNCFPGADIYERELVDLLGINVDGLAPGHRYPLTDDWPKGDYPLRKDYRKKDLENSEVQNA